MPAQVICAVDDSSSAREAVRFAATFSRELGLPLQLVHIVPTKAPGHFTAYSARATREKFQAGALLLREIAGELRVAARHALHAGDPATRLIEIAREEQTAIVVVGSSGRSPRLGSLARNAVAKAPCPVIVVTEPRDARPLQPLPRYGWRRA